MQELFLKLIYGFLLSLRWLFLSGRFGAWLHNLIYYSAWMLIRVTLVGEERLKSTVWLNILGSNQAAYKWQKQIYTSTPKAWQHALKTKFLLRRFYGTFHRRQLEREGHIVPSMITISVNSPASCNLSCAHCYANSHEAAELPVNVFRKVLAEQESLGIYSVMISGGEPLLYKGLMDLFHEFPDTTFDVVTNGTLVTESVVKELASLGNVCLNFSLEGLEEETDKIRGQGVFCKVQAAMGYCKIEHLPYSVIITVTQENFAVATSGELMAFLEEMRCCGVIFSTYLAVGGNPHPEWEITTEQSEMLDVFRERVKREYAMMATVGRNGTAQVTECFAGRQYIHILPNGLAEGCPFVHWADLKMNVRDNSILEITGSPFFQRLREIADYKVAGITPCRAGRYQTMQRFFGEVAESTTIRR